MNASSWSSLRGHKWKLLLAGLVLLLLISPIPEVYNQQDNVISPLMAVVFLAVIFGAAERRWTIWLLAAFTLVWLVISIATEGSGIFVGPSVLAPVLFTFLLVAIFVLLARWLVRAIHINAEVLCAAICGYFLLGILWAGFYAIALKMVPQVRPNDPSPFLSTTVAKVSVGDLLYFSYTTLTTTGFGDIIPRGPEVRMLAVMEAIVGVFYNTIVIARFVGLYGLNKAPDPRPLAKDVK
jgi:hypothetical protein